MASMAKAGLGRNVEARGRRAAEAGKEREEVFNFDDTILSWHWRSTVFEDAQPHLLWSEKKERVVTCRSKIPNYILRGSHAVK